MSQSNDLNSYKSAGFLYWVSATATPQNAPVNVGSTVQVITRKSALDMVTQVCYTYTNKIYIRTFQSSWTAWEELSTNIPSFYKNYDSISGLASALGVWKDCGLTSETEYTSINDIQSGGIWTVNGKKGGGALSDIPTGESTGCLLYFKSTYSAQVFIPMVNTNVFYVRIKIGNNNWLSWVSFSAAV